MGNSLPTVPTEESAPATEQSGGTTDVPTVILPEPEQSGGTTDVPTVILPEAGGVALGQGPVEQEPSENEADSVLGTSPSYADHVEGPEAALTPPPSMPSPGPERFNPSPVAAPFAEARPEAAQTDQAEDEAWGPWRAPEVHYAVTTVAMVTTRSPRGHGQCSFGGPSTRFCLFGGSGTGCCLFGGPICPRCQAPASRDPSWKPSSCWCGPDAERVGGRFAEASVSERARGPPTGGRGFGPAPSGGGRRAVASFIPLLRTPESFGDVRFTCFVLDGQKLPHPSGPGWWWQIARPRDWSHGCQWQGSGLPTRGIWRGDSLCSSETSSVSGGGAAAATAKAAYRPGHDYGQCPVGVACLAKAGPAGQKLERMGIDFFRRYYCRGISRRSTSARGACERRSLDQRPSGRRQEEAEAPAGIPDLGRYPALSQESLEMHRLLRWITQWVPRIVAGTIGCNGVGEARRGHGLGRTGGMEVFGGFGRPQSPATLGQKESEEPHGGCYDGYLVADPESSSREAAASAAADADHACRGQLGLLFGGCVRSFGRVPARGGWRSRVDRYPPLPWYRNTVAARGHHPGVWNTSVAASAVSRGWCCSSFGRKECRRRLLFEPSGRNSSGHTGDGTAHAGGNRTEEPGEPGISYLPVGEAGGKDAFGVGWFDGTIASRGTTSTCFATTSTAAIEEPVCTAPARSFGAIKRANATGKGVYSPLAFGRSIFRAFGRHRFRNRNPIRRLRERGRGRESGYGERQSRFVNSFDLWFLKKKKTFGEHVWHEGFEWQVLGMELGMNVSLICACFGSLGNPEAPQSLQALTLFPSLLCLPFSRVRTPAMFIDVVAATLFAGLLFAWSLLSGIAFWWCSLVLQLFRKLLRRRGLRTKRFRAKCRRKESCFRMKCQGRWVRVWTQRQLVVVRREKLGCSLLLESMLRKCRLFWHVFLGMFGMLVHVCERGDDEQPWPGKAEVSEHRLRALHRGLPLPGAGTSADPLNLDPVDPYDPEGLLEPPAGLPEGRRPPPQPERIIDPSGDPEDPGDETTDLRVPLSSFSLHRHRCNGHFPFDENCTACCSSKGRVPARRLRRKLQRENQTVGLDFFYFGKLRVLLVTHLGSRYTLCLPAAELSDDLAFNLTQALKECGLSGKAVTFRLDNEASLVALVERTARHRACTASAVITDVVPATEQGKHREAGRYYEEWLLGDLARLRSAD